MKKCVDVRSIKVCVQKITYIWNLSTCTRKIDKFFGSPTGGSCNKSIEVTKTVPTKWISANFYILLTFLLP